MADQMVLLGQISKKGLAHILFQASYENHFPELAASISAMAFERCHMGLFHRSWEPQLVRYLRKEHLSMLHLSSSSTTVHSLLLGLPVVCIYCSPV